MVAGICNLIRERALLFKWLEATKTMRAYIAHNMDESEELCSKLKSMESELVVAWKVADEGVGLLKKAEKGK